jgi:uncharacterized protein (UPF0548 family)
VRVVRRSRLASVLSAYEATQVTYREQGATVGQLPPGYRHLSRRTLLGDRLEAFEAAAGALMAWQMHRGAGLAVAATGPIERDCTVVLGVGWPVCFVIPCRVQFVVREAARVGFAYGTLPGHPERGEERFEVVRDGRGQVWLEITAFSVPASRFGAIVGPAGRAAQLLVTRRFERALAALATPSS